MFRHIFCAAFLLLLTASCLPAQQSGSEVPSADAAAGLGVTLIAGYDSHYVFRGEEILTGSLWSQVEISVPLSEALAIGIVPFYLESPGHDYTEFDLNPSLTLTTGWGSITSGYALYYYPDGLNGGGTGISTEQEATLSVSRELGPVEVVVMGAYNFERQGLYGELALSASFELTSSVALEPSAAVGCSSNYFAGDGLSHAGLSVGLPVKLSEQITLRPHVSATLPLAALKESQNPQLFCGLTLSLGF